MGGEAQREQWGCCVSVVPPNVKPCLIPGSGLSAAGRGDTEAGDGPAEED